MKKSNVVRDLISSTVIVCLFATFFFAKNISATNYVSQSKSILETTSNEIKTPSLLKKSAENSRYFADRTGKPVYLTGPHTWNCIQDFDVNPNIKLDYNKYMDWMESHGTNFLRGWIWEEASYIADSKRTVEPLPYARSGPGTALDGLPKYDLNKFNQAYFDRLRSRIIEAGKHGIYVSIMLTNNVSVLNKGWNGNPYNANNNINGIGGSQDVAQDHLVYTMQYPEVVKCHEKFAEKVIDTVNDLENVLYEIGNEHVAASCSWQYHMVNYIKQYESTKKLQHPVGITSSGGRPDALTNKQLFDSPADWISPREEPAMLYRTSPVASDGTKVVITDTDHLWGQGGDINWVWKSFVRGLNPIFMDNAPSYGYTDDWEPIRKNMAYARAYAERINLEKAIPRADLVSSKYCLADFGHEYLVYLPVEKEVTVDLGVKKSNFSIEWMDPLNGVCTSDNILASNKTTFASPYTGSAVLYLKNTDDVATTIAEIDRPDILIFPNPCNNAITIKSIRANSKITIFDMNGKLILNNQSSNNQIDIRHLQPGIYTVKINDNNEIVTRKFIKQ